MEITREKFLDATGREPEQDDLERVNCPLQGGVTHQCCGWCYEHDKPVFECLCASRAFRFVETHAD